MTDKAAQVGGEIDSWCTKCKLVLNHTIVAMVDNRPKRVTCLTCGGQHMYRPNPPGTRASRSSSSGKPTRSRRSAAPVAIDENAPAVDYTPQGSYSVNAIILHPTLGRGRVTSIRGEKMDVQFLDGPRVLIHGRRAGA